MHPQTLTARALATLAQAAQAQGFDTRTHAGRARLAAFAGMPQAQLDAPFVKGDADLVFVIEMARVLAVPLHQLLDESRRHFQFLPLYPYLGGDPLHLPGFPFTFFFYRQISSDNAAITTMAFLKAWDGP